ncbi:MAG: pentapeptide repeat-containing protein [Symploca sp. SIO3C6]|nr:pentapeptide repeat-containing protein [Symploca sp. SIO3C6]
MRIRIILVALWLSQVFSVGSHAQETNPNELYNFCSRFPLNPKCQGVDISPALENLAGELVDCSLALGDFQEFQKCKVLVTNEELTVYIEYGPGSKKMNFPLSRVFAIKYSEWQRVIRQPNQAQRQILSSSSEMEIGLTVAASETQKNRSNFLRLNSSASFGRKILRAIASTPKAAPKQQLQSLMASANGSSSPAQLRQSSPQVKRLLETNECIGCDLRGASLEGVELEQANLEGANLQGVNLQQADLKGAYLVGANLQGAILTEADLSEAILVYASMEQAELDEIKLRGANLEGASLKDANLSGANLNSKGRKITYLLRADLTNANLSNSSLEGVNFLRANLQGSNLEGANLSEIAQDRTLRFGKTPVHNRTVLNQANLSNANLRGTNLQSAQLTEANLRGADLSQANLKRANLSRAILSEARLINADLRGVDLSNAQLSNSNLEGSNLCGVEMPDGSISQQGC